MKLASGSALANYRITAELGAGGMGEVWRAEDTKLGREVALKVLPEEFAKDPERMARFEREAKVLASLNHANIATLYGLETVASGTETETGTETVFLAMELVEGEDLSERIKRGPVPVEEAAAIALQIAEALEAAHEQGIVHRDLKPANVKLRSDGAVKVLDFGLAKAWENESGDSSLSMSPTLTAHATAAGVILGTAAYMAPEQASGMAADRRADIWAFGVVLWEMLTGRKLFEGETVSHVLASVLKDEVDVTALPQETPGRIRELVKRCLKKNPQQRLQAIGDARIVFDEYLDDPEAFQSFDRLEEARVVGSSALRKMLPWSAALAAVVALLAGLVGWSLRGPEREIPLRKLEIPTEGVPEKALLSPDGRHLSYISEEQLWLRDLQRLESKLVPTSDGVETLFWSDDGKWLAFGAESRIWKVAAEGTDPVMVAQVSDDFDWASGGAWIGDRIFFVTGDTGFFEVTARGGDPKLVLAPEEDEDDFHHPSALPDGRGLLFVLHDGKGINSIWAWAEGERKELLRLDGQTLESPTYSSTGHLLFGRQPDNPGVWAVAFDVEQLEVTGELFLAAADASWPSVAADGTLAYISGTSLLPPAQLVWFDREGRELGPIGQAGPFWPRFKISPDGRRIVAPAGDMGEVDQWIIDIERGTQTRLTFGEGVETNATWTRDGSRVAYRGNFGENRGIVIQLADGTREPELLVETGAPGDFSPDGDRLLYTAYGETTKRDLWLIDLVGGAEPVPYLRTDAEETAARIDPTGRFVAHMSDESGRQEIYIRSFPDAGGKWQVSVNGGFWPVWNPRGGELFFADDRRVMVVDVETEPSLRLGAPRPLFALPGSGRTIGSWPDYFAVAPDGERFVVLRSASSEAEDARPPSVVVVDSWLSEFEEAD
jgi:serine/threonine protein kinase